MEGRGLIHGDESPFPRHVMMTWGMYCIIHMNRVRRLSRRTARSCVVFHVPVHMHMSDPCKHATLYITLYIAHMYMYGVLCTYIGNPETPDCSTLIHRGLVRTNGVALNILKKKQSGAAESMLGRY